MLPSASLERGSSPTLHSFLESLTSFFLLIKGLFYFPLGGPGLGGVINIWPAKPFETATVIKVYTNKSDLTY